MIKKQEHLPLVISLILTALILAISTYFRPLLPVDETRYVSVAWEMWQSGNWLVPFKNGELYTHKPPMMFWIINLVWSLSGVSEILARLSIPLLGCLNLFLVAALAKRLYPEIPRAASLSPLILFSFLGWQLYIPAIMFDLLLTVFVLSAYLTLCHFAQSGRYRYALLAGLATGFGMLAKGPVIFVYLLPFMFSFRLWQRYNMVSGKTWAKGCLLTIGVSLPILFAWAIPAIISAGEAFAFDIFWHQTAGRLHKSFAHARPLYWYLMVLPVLLFPWLFLEATWKRANWQKPGSQDAVLIIPLSLVLLIFSLISGKQVHYLYPVFPLLAILIAAKFNAENIGHERILGLFILGLAALILFAGAPLKKLFPLMDVSMAMTEKGWALVPLAMAMLVFLSPRMALFKRSPNLTLPALVAAFSLSLFSLFPALSPVLHYAYDIAPAAQQIGQLQSQGIPVAYAGKYHGQFQFSGRLTAPLEVIEDTPEALEQWGAKHPNGYIVTVRESAPKTDSPNSLYIHPYRSKLNVIFPAISLLNKSQ